MTVPNPDLPVSGHRGDVVAACMEVLAEGLSEGAGKQALAEVMAARLREQLCTGGC